jgi:hypothetical protein
MALLDNPHTAMYPYHLMNSRLAAAAGLGSSGPDAIVPQHGGHPMNGYVNGRFDMRLGGSQSSSSNRSSTSPNRHHLDAVAEETDSSPTHQTVLNATMSLKLESGYHHRFGQNRSAAATFRPFSADSPDIDSGEEARRDLKVTDLFPASRVLISAHSVSYVIWIWFFSLLYSQIQKRSSSESAL